MPYPGETKLGREIGRLGKGGHNRFIWEICPDCQKGRWVQGKTKLPLRCRPCENKTPERQKCLQGHRESRVGENHPMWRGGRMSVKGGYIQVWCHPDDFFYRMADQRSYIMEHRLVMAKHLGRCLHPWEIVHHLNGIKNDNRLGNLQLTQEMQHKQITLMENRIKQLETRVTLLEAENAALRVI